MSKKNKHKNNKSYIDEMKEWQEHQYDPGYYTNGRIPPYMKYPGKPRLYGWLLILSGILSIIILTVICSISFDKKQIVPIIGFILLFGLIAAIQIVGGIRLLMKSYKKHRNISAIFKKNILVSLIIIFLVISICDFVYKINEFEGKIYIYSWEQYTIDEVGSRHYVTLVKENIKLNCDADTDTKLSRKAMILEDENKKYLIFYRSNRLLPSRGKIIKMEEIK